MQRCPQAMQKICVCVCVCVRVCSVVSLVCQTAPKRDCSAKIFPNHPNGSNSGLSYQATASLELEYKAIQHCQHTCWFSIVQNRRTDESRMPFGLCLDRRLFIVLEVTQVGVLCRSFVYKPSILHVSCIGNLSLQRARIQETRVQGNWH